MRIVIQRDGRIAVCEHGSGDSYADPANPYDILRLFRAQVEFEPGLTAFQMMKALRPWSAALSAAGWIDFDAWFAAMEKPPISLAGEDSERLSGIELHPEASVNRFDDDGGRSASIHIYWRPLGRYANPEPNSFGRVEEHCSISFTDPRLIGHLPLSIRHTVKVKDSRSHAPWGEDPILPQSSPGVYDRIVDYPSFFDGVVLGFLDDISFHGSPEDTDDVAEGLREAVEEIHSGAVVPVSLSGGEGGERKSILQLLDIDGADDIVRRADIARDIRNAMANAGVPDGEMAEKMGLTASGLAKLAAGRIADFSDATLERFLDTARSSAAAGAGSP